MSEKREALTAKERARKMVELIIQNDSLDFDWESFYISQIKEVEAQTRHEVAKESPEFSQAFLRLGRVEGWCACREAVAKKIEKPENRTVGLADGVQQEYAKIARSLQPPSGEGR